MNTLKAFAVLLLPVTFSCKDGGQVKQKPAAQKAIQQKTIAKKDSAYITTPETITTHPTADTVIMLHLNEMTVFLNGLEVETYDYDSISINNPKDTAILSLAVGESFEDKNFTVQSDLLTDITIQQRYETSVTIMNEGPHCDLTDWKHYNSPWTVLYADKNANYRTLTYTENDWSKFVPVTVAELKEAVKEHCDETWYEHIRNVHSVKEYPVSVSISRIFLRIAGTRKDDGRQVVKIIVALMPMGC